VFPQPQHRTIHRHANPAQPATQTQQGSALSDNDIRRWAMSGLDADPASSVPARRAYEGFCDWARGQGIEPPTETYFGRQLTKEIALLGGRKRRPRNATVYSGIGLADRQALGPTMPTVNRTFGGKGGKTSPRSGRMTGPGHPCRQRAHSVASPDDRSHHGQRLATQGRKKGAAPRSPFVTEKGPQARFRPSQPREGRNRPSMAKPSEARSGQGLCYHNLCVQLQKPWANLVHGGHHVAQRGGVTVGLHTWEPRGLLGTPHQIGKG
jgi:hypothetical protein